MISVPFRHSEEKVYAYSGQIRRKFELTPLLITKLSVRIHYLSREQTLPFCLFIKVSCSHLHGWLLNRQEVESFLALHALLLIWVIWRESSGVGAHGWLLIIVMELESVHSLAVLVKAVAQVHLY